MKLTRAGSKNHPVYYVQKSYRDGSKTSTKTIERLGSIEEIAARAGGQDPLEWAKAYVKKITEDEKTAKQDVIIRYSASHLIEKDTEQSVNVGYLFLQQLYYSLGLDKICSTISDKYKFEYDLNSILSMLVYSRIIFPGSKQSSLLKSKTFLEKPECDLHQVYRALEILARESDQIQAKLYRNSNSVHKRNKNILYYDCTNFYFEIEEADEFRRYGHSKEHRPNPIVQMGLFMDTDGIPLSFSVFSGNQNEQPSLKPLETKILRDFGSSEFVVCTDAGLASIPNRKFNDIQGRKFVTAQPIKKLKGFLQDFCLADEGWKLPGSNRTYRLSELDESLYYDSVFYRDRWINENGLEQHLIVTYSIKYRDYLRYVRERQIERAKSMADRPSSMKKSSSSDPKRFVRQTHCTSDGEVATKSVTFIDQERIEYESKYDGFYAVCTNLEGSPQEIVNINRRRWEIEECFRIMKTDFKARPVYLNREDRITAHFLTCFISLVIFRLLEIKLKRKYTCSKIIQALRSMNMLIARGEGYIPAYTRTELTDLLHDTFKFRTDYEITSKSNMKKICSLTKKG